ncbi:hypothetical protein D3C85_1707650 [compost metagenome]
MQIGTQIQAELTHKSFGCAVHVSTCVRPASGGRADINDMTAVTLDHARQHRAGHVHQPFVVGVDHVFPVFDAGFMRRLHPQRQTGVVDQ